MRWYRRDDMDDLPSPEPVFRSDALREHVDRLPPLQKHVIERVFFGGADLFRVATEIGITRKHARDIKDQALATLQAKVLKDHKEVGAVRPAPLGAVDPRLVSEPPRVARQGHPA